MSGLKAKSYNLKANSGFTLIELLVVIAIISLLASMVLTSLGQSRVKARDSKLVRDLIQVRNALELYRAANNDRYPPDCQNCNGSGETAFLNRRIDCWDCALTLNFRDPNKLAALDPYLKPRPIAPTPPGSGANTSRGFWYKVNPCRTEYKMAVIDSVTGYGVNRYAYVPSSMIDASYAPFPSISVYSSEISKNWQRNDIFSPNTCP